jgi:hypothetical protein
MPMLAGLLPDLERAAERWEVFERRWRAAQAVRDDGLHVEDPPEPEWSIALLFWVLLHAPAYAPAVDRRDLVAALQNRRHPLPDTCTEDTFTVEEFLPVLVGEALAAGIACDYDTPEQAWTVLAELLLRDVDIGEIIARVHPDRCDPRSPRPSTEELRERREPNIDRARKERKRVNRKREAFGYRTR